MIFLLEIVVVAEEMAVSLYRFILTLLLCREVLCQCYNELDCVGDVLPSEDQRDCCVSQNGLTYNGGGTCRPCIGSYCVVVCLRQSRNSVFLQFMDSEMLCMMLMRIIE